MSEQRSVAFVTGATEGLGAATALALANADYDVAVSDLRAESLAPTVASIKDTGRRAHAVALDLRVPDSITAAFKAVQNAFGRIDVLVNNAGVTLRKSALDTAPEDWNGVIGTNLTGTFFATQAMGRQLIAAGRPGSVVTIASAHGMVGFKDRSAYGVSKAALIHMTKMLAIEWAEHRIRLNAIAPGTVETPSRAQFLADPDSRKTMLSRIPLGRFGNAEEVAAAAVYLASPQAAYITGQTLLLDGGLTAY